ncbi:hypothetical protein Tdes44962_MAKER09476 [Teratosphaeria destructans]|uniref:Uncharacterized protein n=1 Tax=Teratosphaeria destructans TaxID=418781 RepID=A0A9W7SSQ9_9PEZI|nr:hypothetical protein Tdes44962_MAKER09476 [Teratosphaeria destructans]
MSLPRKLPTPHHLPSLIPPAFLSLHYHPAPNPLTHFALHPSTQELVRDPSHPFYPRTIARLRAHPPTKTFHIRVQTRLDVTGSAFIRKWAARRLRQALVRELREQGYDEHGRVVDGEGGAGLSGAAQVILWPHPLTLTASREDLKAAASYILQIVRKKSSRGHP